MRSKIKKRVPLIDQHDKNFMYGGKFGGNFIPETLKKPIEIINVSSSVTDKLFFTTRLHRVPQQGKVVVLDIAWQIHF